MKIEQAIINKRKSLRETQKEFGKRFGVTGMLVSYWESGQREAPYKVIYFVQGNKVCPGYCDVCLRHCQFNSQYE